jgi:enamine deaminase RidA (YjgF/YER057c/UK114 family)
VVGKGDVRAQAQQVFENLRAVLEAAGSGLDLVGKITVYTTDLGHKSAIAEARQRVWGADGHVPAATFVVISSLAEPELLLEIEAVAALRRPRRPATPRPAGRRASGSPRRAE